MNHQHAKVAGVLDPMALSAFAATLSTMPVDEIRKAKVLYLRNAIVDFEAQRSSGKGFLIVMGIMSIIPIFLVVFIPALLAFQAGNKATKQKILNAVAVWREDLGADAAEIQRMAEAL